MAGTTRLILDLLHAHRVSHWRLCRSMLNLFTIRICSLMLTPSVRKSAELAKNGSHHYHSAIKKEPIKGSFLMAGTTRLELATSCVTGMRSNQTELRSHLFWLLLYYICWFFFCKHNFLFFCKKVLIIHFIQYILLFFHLF